MMTFHDLPAKTGSYALWFSLPAPIQRPIGRLGTFDFPQGAYLYFGSAQGLGGLRARVGHHARNASHPHWHLDWLRPEMILLGGWITENRGSWECAWSQAVVCLPGAAIYAPGFGAADCHQGCVAHLIGLPAKINPDDIVGILEETSINLVGKIAWFSAE